MEKYKKKREKELKKKKATAAAAEAKPEAKTSSKKKEIAYGGDSTDIEMDNKENKKTSASSKKSELKKTSSLASNKTIENSDMDEDGDDWKLPSFFEGKTFFIYNDFDFNKRKVLSRVILAYAG